MREDQVSNGVSFLTHPKVQQAPLEERLTFLRNKGLTEEEIEEAVRRAENPDGDNAEGALQSGENGANPASSNGGDANSGKLGMKSGQHVPRNNNNSGPPHFQGLPPPSVPVQDESSSWVSKYLVPGTLALSAGAGMAFLYKTMVLKENMGGPRQWFGPGPPPPGVYPGMPVQQQQQQLPPGQQQPPQAQHLQQQHSNSSLPGAPGAMEALLGQGKPIPSLEQLEKDRAGGQGQQSTAMTTYDPSSSMFGSAPYGSAQGMGSDLMASGFGAGSEDAGGLGAVVKKQTELLQDVSSTLKSVTSQLADIKADRGDSGGFGLSTSGGTQAMIANLSQTTSDLKSELNTLKMLILAGKIGGGSGDGAMSEEDIRKLVGPVDEKLSQQQQNRNQLDQLIKAASSKTADDAAPTAADGAAATNSNQDGAQADEAAEKTDEQIAQEKMHASRTALAQMVEACPADKLRVAVNLLLLYLRNLAKDPEVPRYGRIARTNQSYINNLSEIEHHIDLLKANGFEERNSGSLARAPTLEWSEEWREKKDEWAVRVLKDTIENLETVQKQGASAAPAVSSSAPSTTTSAPAASSQNQQSQNEEAPKAPTSTAAQPAKQSGYVAPPFSMPGSAQTPTPSPPPPQQQQQQQQQQPPQTPDANPAASASTTASGSGPQQTEEPQYPLSYMDICKYVQKGEEPPGIKKIPDNLSSDAPTSASMAPVPKPWERDAAAAAATPADAPQGNPFNAFANGDEANGEPVSDDVAYPSFMNHSSATIEEINDDETDPAQQAQAANGSASSAAAPTLPFPEMNSASEVAAAAPSAP